MRRSSSLLLPKRPLELCRCSISCICFPRHTDKGSLAACARSGSGSVRECAHCSIASTMSPDRSGPVAPAKPHGFEAGISYANSVPLHRVPQTTHATFAAYGAGKGCPAPILSRKSWNGYGSVGRIHVRTMRLRNALASRRTAKYLLQSERIAALSLTFTNSG